MRPLAAAFWLVATTLPRLASAQDVIFTDGFESADLSAWDGRSTDRRRPRRHRPRGDGRYPHRPGRPRGRHGRALRPGRHAGRRGLLPRELPLRSARLRSRRGAGRFRTRVFIGFEEAPTRRLLAVVLRRIRGNTALMARARRDDNSQANTASSPSRRAHAIEIAWQPASEPDVADGNLELWIDGVPVLRLVGLRTTSAPWTSSAWARSASSGRVGHAPLGRVRVAPRGLHRPLHGRDLPSRLPGGTGRLRRRLRGLRDVAAHARRLRRLRRALCA